LGQGLVSGAEQLYSSRIILEFGMFQELLQAAATREAAGYRGRSSLSSQRKSKIPVRTGEVRVA